MSEGYVGYLAEHEGRFLEELFEFLRIPSVSGYAEHREDMERAAEWVAARLRAAGVPSVELLANPDGGPPIVSGRMRVGEDRPTVLIYGHYDLQPAGDLDAWISPPFEPEVRDGAIYARGASDDKGLLVAVIAAVEALGATGAMPDLNLSFCFEGAEETLTTGLADLIRAEPERFACDVLLSADGTMFSREHLSLTVSTKGVSALRIEVRTAGGDLHSGMYGATVPNAGQVLARLIASLHDDEGRVAVAGFYDEVRELTEGERAEIAATPFDPGAFLGEIGATGFWGEPGYTPLERLAARPTIDLVGIVGGPVGEAVKAIMPGVATAKLSCRLVPDQDPERMLDLIEAHLRRHCPAGADLTVHRLPGIHPFHIRRDHSGLALAREILREMGGREPLVQWVGGTLPVAAAFQQAVGAEMVFLGWSMPDANVHAPNEFLRLEDFRACALAYCRYLTRFARVTEGARPSA